MAQEQAKAKLANLSGVLICTPCYGQAMTMHTANSLFHAGQLMTAQGIPNTLYVYSLSDIVEARNIALTNWFDNYPEISHLLFVDSDMDFSPALIRDMLAFAIARAQHLIGVLYCSRDTSQRVIGRLLDGSGDEIDLCGGFARVKDVGGGVMLIGREAVTKMMEANPGLSGVAQEGVKSAFGITRLIRAFDPVIDPDTKERVSEDYSFCYRWREVGGEVWANTEHPIGHVGPHKYVHRFADILEGKVAPPKPKEKLPPGLPVWQEAAE